MSAAQNEPGDPPALEEDLVRWFEHLVSQSHAGLRGAERHALALGCAVSYFSGRDADVVQEGREFVLTWCGRRFAAVAMEGPDGRVCCGWVELELVGSPT